MSELINKLVLMLDPDCDKGLLAFATESHVWVVDTPQNRMVVSDYWARMPKAEDGTRITIFSASESMSSVEICLNILETIDVHHGKHSSDPPYSVLEVHGLPISQKAGKVKAAIKKLGFRSFDEMADGLRASR